MTEPQDILQPNQEQEAILQKSPFLRTFLNQPVDITGKWLDELDPLAEHLERELSQKLGNHWLTTTLGPMTLMAAEQDVFDTSLIGTGKKDETNNLFRVVRSLFLIGYEVGNKSEASSFSVPVSGKLAKSGLFDHPVPEDQVESYSQRVFNTVWGIIESGAFIKLYLDQENLPKGSQSSKDPLKEFIQGLEVIDKLPPEGA